MSLSDRDHAEHLSILRSSYAAVSDIVGSMADKHSKTKEDSDETDIFSTFIASQVYYFAMANLNKTDEASDVLTCFVECMPWIPEEKMLERFDEYLPLFTSGLTGKSSTPFFSLASSFLEKLSDYSLDLQAQTELCVFLGITIEPAIIQTLNSLKYKKGVGDIQPSGAHISLSNDDEISYHAKQFVNLQQNQKGGCFTLILCASLLSLFIVWVL